MKFKTLTSVLVLSTLMAGSETMAMDPNDGDKNTTTKALTVAPTPTPEENTTSTPPAIVPENPPQTLTEEQTLIASTRYPDLVKQIEDGRDPGANETAQERGKAAENTLATKISEDMQNKDIPTTPLTPLTEKQKGILSRLFGGWASETVASSAPAATPPKEEAFAWTKPWTWGNRAATTPPPVTPVTVPVTEVNGDVAPTNVAPTPIVPLSTETTDKPASIASPVVLRDEIKELADLTPTVVEIYRIVKESQNLKTPKEIVQCILEKKGYVHWSKLTPSEQDDFLVKAFQ